MEFEEMKKIWDVQTQRPLYAINENMMHRHILSKKRQADHITNVSELMPIFVNGGSGIFILLLTGFKHSTNIFMYLMPAWMFITAALVLVSRVRRIQGELKFDRSMLGDLNHAISTASYQVFLSQAMRWNILPIALLCVLAIWYSGKSPWLAVTLLVFFMIAYFASGWEHSIYKNKRKVLKELKRSLQTI